MKLSFLDVPERAQKPRTRGLTMVLDSGEPQAVFEDVLRSHAPLIDTVKLGWGTSLVTPDLERKLACARELDIPLYFGGTLFEAAVRQQRLPAFKTFLQDLGVSMVEVSNGTIDLPNERKAEYIRELAADFTVISEVGYKDQERSRELHPALWIEYIQQDLEAGAAHVLTEARESGRSGVCRADGEVRYGLITEILESGLDVNRIVFEAPNKALQTYFIRRVGPEVNLANIPFGGVIGVETLRLGLRGDTLLDFA